MKCLFLAIKCQDIHHMEVLGLVEECMDILDLQPVEALEVVGGRSKYLLQYHLN